MVVHFSKLMFVGCETSHEASRFPCVDLVSRAGSARRLSTQPWIGIIKSIFMRAVSAHRTRSPLKTAGYEFAFVALTSVEGERSLLEVAS